ncbi:MAG: WG repeat-containing protein [Bacteroidia bacterium]
MYINHVNCTRRNNIVKVAYKRIILIKVLVIAQFFLSAQTKIFKENGTGKFGITNVGGKFILKPIYDSIISCYDYYDDSRNFYFVREKNKWFFFNIEGNGLSQLKYNEPGIHLLLNGQNNWIVSSERGTNILNELGKELINENYDKLLKFENRDSILALKNGKWGVLNNEGKIVFPFLYDTLVEFTETQHTNNGLRYLFVGKRNQKDKSQFNYGIADYTGTSIINPEYAYIPILFIRRGTDFLNWEKHIYMDSSFKRIIVSKNGTGKVNVKHSTNVETLDELGNIVEMSYNVNAYSFSSSGEFGILDNNANWIISPTYQELVLPFAYLIDEALPANKYSSVFETKNIPDHYTSCYTVNQELPIVCKANNMWGAIDWSGKEIVKPVFDSIKVSSSKNKFIFKVYEKGKFGFLDSFGKTATGQKFASKIMSLSLVNDSLLPEYLEGNQPKGCDVNLYAGDLLNKNVQVVFDEVIFDEFGNEEMRRVKQNLETCTSNNLYLTNDSSEALIAGSKSMEDVLFTTNGNYFLSPKDIRMQLNFRYWLQYPDSFYLDDKGFKYYDNVNAYNPIFREYYFAKRNDKWFIYKLGDSIPANNSNPFDSIEPVYIYCYKAYQSGKYMYFNYTQKAGFNKYADIIYPVAINNDDLTYRLMCSNCDYTNKNYSYDEKIYEYNEWGEITKDSSITIQYKLPVINSGKFNLISSQNKIVLEQDVDEIIFPKLNDKDWFNMKDTSTTIYREKAFIIGDPDYRLINTCKKSIAVKEGKYWSLVKFEDANIKIEKLNDVQQEGEYWICKKKKKTLKYKVEDLSLQK